MKTTHPRVKQFLCWVSRMEGHPPDRNYTWELHHHFPFFRWWPRWFHRLVRKVWVQGIWQRLCNRFTGHDISECSDSGYSGGNYYTQHCRWCDFPIQVPVRESSFYEDVASWDIPWANEDGLMQPPEGI